MERPSQDTRRSREGIWAAVGAFTIWGVFPLYLRPLLHVPPLTILAHRVVWCCLLVNGWLAARGELGSVRAALGGRGTLTGLSASAALIGCNWLTYVWAVSSGHVVESSLGYFINPLVNVLLGVAVLGERLRRPQWIAVGIAAVGVAWLTIQSGKVPWIALALALTFGGYGLLRKVVAVEALPGLAAETTLAAPLALAWLAWQAHAGSGWFGGSDGFRQGWLVASGIVTAVPLSLFAFGARRIPYSTVGIIQYIGPTLQLAAGVLAFHEPFPAVRAIGFAFIWVALAVYAAEGLLFARRTRAAYAPAAEAERI